MSASRWTTARQFRVLAAAICVALILPRIAQPGMFVDGVTYAVLARNLAAGFGTFWAPSFSTTVYPVFHEQPPLGLALESLAFTILGDHLYVERLFSVAVFAATAFLIAALWRRLLPRDYDWLPVLFWILPSTVTWGAINNMLEGTQALFTTTAVLLLIDAVRATGLARSLLSSALAAACVVAACLIKGPVGLFPLVVPPLALLLLDERRRHVARVLTVTLAVLAMVAAAALVIAANVEARQAVAEFSSTHLMPALRGERGLPRRAFDIGRHFTLGILARMCALALVLWMIRPRRRPIASTPWMVSLFFLAVGLCASLPLLPSPVLAGHYFLPSVPFFALAVAAAALPAVQVYREPSASARGLLPLGLAAGLVLLAVAVLLVRGPMERRDVALIGALRAMDGQVPRNTTIGTCASAARNWGLHGYSQRFFRLSLAATDAPRDGWFLTDGAGCQVPPGCVQKATGGDLSLFRCDAGGAH